MRSSGMGLSTSITAPNTIARAPPAPKTPCDANFTSSANSVKASTSSAAPSQLMGSTEMADRPSSTRMPPNTPGAITPGDVNST